MVLTFQCVIYNEVPFENTSVFISRICLIYQISKHRRLIFSREKLDHRMKKKLRMLCV